MGARNWLTYVLDDIRHIGAVSCDFVVDDLAIELLYFRSGCSVRSDFLE